MNKQLSVDAAKPVVRIVAIGAVPENVIQNICWGLEEEGVPGEVQKVASGSAIVNAKRAAEASKLNVGISVHCKPAQAVLHHRNLKEEEPLFNLLADNLCTSALRCLGTNAARIVKGVPLVLKQHPCNSEIETEDPSFRQSGVMKTGNPLSADLDAMIARVVAEIVDFDSSREGK